MGITLNFSVITTEIVFILISSLIFLTDRFVKNKNYNFYLVFITLIAGIILASFTPYGNFTYAYQNDYPTTIFKLIVLFGGVLITLISYNYLQKFEGLNYGEYYGLILFSLVGSFIMISAMDLLTIYLGLELMSFPVYFLIALNYAYNKTSLEGSLKYFLMGSLGSLFILIGLGIVYYFIGTFTLSEISHKLLSHAVGNKILLLAFIFILGGFSIKLSFVPFHMWAPDAYESAPVPITSFIASIMKFTAIVTLIKVILIGFYPLKIQIGELLIPIILLSILIGNIMAIKQDNIIRMLAYSSIAHAGYAGLGLISGNYQGYSFSIFYMTVYLIMTIGIFSILVFLANSNEDLLSIPNLAGFSKKSPFVSFLLLIFLFSLAGVPPTAGFMAKFYVFLFLIKAKYIWVALLAILFSVIGAYPYLRVVKVIYMDEKDITLESNYGVSFLLPACLTAILIIVLGVYPQVLTNVIYKTINFYVHLFFFPH